VPAEGIEPPTFGLQNPCAVPLPVARSAHLANPRAQRGGTKKAVLELTEAEVEQIASRAAKEAVNDLLLKMGVDVSKPDALIEMQADFAHTRKWRKSVETVQRQGLLTAVGVLVTGGLGALYMAFKAH